MHGDRFLIKNIRRRGQIVNVLIKFVFACQMPDAVSKRRSLVKSYLYLTEAPEGYQGGSSYSPEKVDPERNADHVVGETRSAVVIHHVFRMIGKVNHSFRFKCSLAYVKILWSISSV